LLQELPAGERKSESRRPISVNQRLLKESAMNQFIRRSTSSFAGKHRVIGLGGLLGLLLGAGCSGNAGSGESVLHAVIGPAGGELVGAQGTALEGVHLVVPPGALAADTDVSIAPATTDVALPKTAVRCGPEFTIEPAGLALAAPATLTLPFDENTIATNFRFDDEVKVWTLDGTTWGQAKQTDSAEGRVSIELGKLMTLAAGVNPPAEQDIVEFDFHPNATFSSCLAQYPDDPDRAPSVHATVVRGRLNDGMFLRGSYIKPELAFDLFTVEKSFLSADGTPDPSFTNFGMAWYQSDLEANERGKMSATIRTILLDQIFGFDPTVGLAPTNTFQVGFWFNNPADAKDCGFDVTKPTPFNGEHKAGPLAMITVPDATSGLGPLCTKPDTSVSPARCDP
jgi:hypothetical protein